MTTVDVRRRKSELTLSVVLNHQRRVLKRTGDKHVRLLVTEDQQRQFYSALQAQTRWEGPPPSETLTWNSMTLEVK